MKKTIFLQNTHSILSSIFISFAILSFFSGCVTEVIEKEKPKPLKVHNIPSKLGTFNLQISQLDATYDIQMTSEDFSAREGLYTFSYTVADKCPKTLSELQQLKNVISTDAVLIKAGVKKQFIYKKISTDIIPNKMLLTARINEKDSLLLCSSF